MLPGDSIRRQCPDSNSGLGGATAAKKQTIPFILANSGALLGGHKAVFVPPRGRYLGGVSHVQGQAVLDFPTLRSVMVQTL